MKILDRYIIRYFLINFAILLVVLSVLFTIVNVIVDLDEFLEAGQIRADQFGGSSTLATLWSVLDYNGPLMVLIYVFFSGLLVVAAMGFTFSGLSRTGEIGAMVTSGVSLYRVAASVVVAGALLNGLTLPLQELVIPPLASKLGRSPSQVKFDEIKPFEIHYASDDQGNLLSATEYKATSKTLLQMRVLERTPDGIPTGRTTADVAVWDDTREGWRLENGWHMPFDTVGYNQGNAIDFLPSAVTPDVLMARQAALYAHLKSIRELQTMAANPVVDSGTINKVIHSRFSLLVMNVLILVMGLPFFLLRQPANMLAQAIKCAGVCITAWAMGQFILQTGDLYISSLAVAWLPVVILLPISAVMLFWVKS